MKRNIYVLIFTTIIISAFFSIGCYSPRYAYRVLVWQDASYDDYKKFKSSEIKKAETPFHFIKGTKDQEKRAISTFEKHASIDNLEAFLKEQKTRSFMVIRNDTVLYEKYFFDNTKETLQTSFSVSKSILSLLVGIAIQNQHIKSIHDPITDYIPELESKDERFKEITIAHLLSMKSGLKFDHKTSFPFFNQDSPRTYYHPNLRKSALKYSKIETGPDEEFLYNNYNPLLVGMALERAIGQSVSSYLQEHLWEKIGTEFDSGWSTDEHEFEKMESGFNAAPVDFAKIGKLVLNKGKWNGEQVVNRDWITFSTQPTPSTEYGNPRSWRYNYFWWAIPENDKESEIMGIGNLGQYIYISPSTNTIIVRNGERPTNIGDGTWIDVFYNYVNTE